MPGQHSERDRKLPEPSTRTGAAVKVELSGRRHQLTYRHYAANRWKRAVKDPNWKSHSSKQSDDLQQIILSFLCEGKLRTYSLYWRPSWVCMALEWAVVGRWLGHIDRVGVWLRRLQSRPGPGHWSNSQERHGPSLQYININVKRPLVRFGLSPVPFWL